MSRAHVIFAALFLTGCGGPRTAASVPQAVSMLDTTALVVIDRPTVIGFFPPAKDSTEASEEGYSEGEAHIGFALQDAEACLGRASAQVILVVDTAVRILRGMRTDTIQFSRVDSLSYGAYLLRPRAQPLLLNAYGPSQLNHVIAEAIPEYFHRKPCGAK